MKTFKQIREEMQLDERALEGVEIHSVTNQPKHRADNHHIHINGKHVATVDGPYMGEHGKYSIRHPDESKNSDSEGNWGHPDHRMPRTTKAYTGETGLLGRKKTKEVVRQGSKEFATLHQAVRAVALKHKEQSK